MLDNIENNTISVKEAAKKFPPLEGRGGGKALTAWQLVEELRLYITSKGHEKVKKCI